MILAAFSLLIFLLAWENFMPLHHFAPLIFLGKGKFHTPYNFPGHFRTPYIFPGYFYTPNIFAPLFFLEWENFHTPYDFPGNFHTP